MAWPGEAVGKKKYSQMGEELGEFWEYNVKVNYLIQWFRGTKQQDILSTVFNAGWIKLNAIQMCLNWIDFCDDSG